MDDTAISNYKMFIYNIGLLLGQLSNDRILELLKEEGVTEKQISSLTNNIIDLSKIFYK